VQVDRALGKLQEQQLLQRYQDVNRYSGHQQQEEQEQEQRWRQHQQHQQQQQQQQQQQHDLHAVYDVPISHANTSDSVRLLELDQEYVTVSA